MVDLRSVIGSLFSIFAFMVGNVTTSILQNASLIVAIITGLLTAVYTIMKILDLKNKKNGPGTIKRIN